MNRPLLTYLAPIVAFLLIVVALASFLFTFISYGLPPCREPSFASLVANWAVPTSFFISAVMFVRLTFKGGWKVVALTLLLPVTAVGCKWATDQFEAARQTQCVSQSWQEAFASCQANPSHYRFGKDQYGYPTLTVYAPGSTDRSWQCLSDWALYNGKFSILVDESVYVIARSRYERARSATRQSNVAKTK